ncbi:bud neck involved protein [Entomortierella lignicola]|nr:bud neck involved protein [Entomortierella lignicola]
MVTTASNQHSSSESSLACSLSSWDVDNGTKFDLSLPRSQSTLASTNQTSTQPTPTRTIKKKLSFASISSFFGSRNLQERRAKQQRSSSLPHVENPLVAVGRQIAGFQRRSSLNDIHDNGTKTKTQSAHDRIIPPWEKNNISHQINIPSSVPAPSPFLEVATRTPTKKLSFNNVFNKQLKKRKNVNTKPAPPVPAKPLKSALVHRSPSFAAAKAHIVHTRRRSASVRSQSSSIRRHQQQRHLQNSPQRQSRQPPCPSDTLARLAEANQALASLRKPLLPGDYDVCLSQTLDAPEDMVPQANTVSPPKPRVNPVMTRGVLAASKARSDPNYSPPLNPLATLSRSSSYCSFSSSPEGVDVSRSYNAEDGGSFSSSTYSTQFEVSTPNIYLQQQQQQPRSESIENGQTTPGHNSLLPASAARISVDQIAVDTQTKQQSSAYDVDDMLAGNLFSTFEFSSTMSNSTAASSTSSPSDNNVTHSSGNSIYRSLHGYPHQQSNYQQLKHQQQQFLAPEYYQPYEHQYYIEGQNDQVQGQSLFIDLTPQQDCQYQTYYYEDITYSPRPSRQLQFSTEGPIIHETWTPEQYDRTSDPNITASHLTPAIAQTIKLELNQFKSQEMEVHQDSRMYTHFFI